MATVTNTVLLPDGTGARDAVVVIRLVASTDPNAESQGFGPAGELVGESRPRVSATGAWSATLTANSAITPAGSVYQVVTQVPGRAWLVDYISVPAGTASYTVQSLLTDPPAAIAPSALGGHIGNPLDAHDASAISFIPSGAITAEDVQGAIAQAGSGSSSPWVALGALGATETVTAAATQESRFFGTLDANTAITVSIGASGSIELKLTQDATGGRNPTWVGVNSWTTLSGQPPVLSSRGAGVDDWIVLENIGGTIYGTWVTESSKGVVTLTDGATINTNMASGQVFAVTIAGNRTLANPTNGVAGQQLLYRIKQDATGSRTITWGAKFRFSQSNPSPVLSTTAAKTDYIGFIYHAVDDRWDCLAYSLGF